MTEKKPTPISDMITHRVKAFMLAPAMIWLWMITAGFMIRLGDGGWWVALFMIFSTLAMLVTIFFVDNILAHREDVATMAAAASKQQPTD